MTAKLKTSFSCEIPRSNVASPFLFEPVAKSGASHSCLKVSHRRTPPATHITSCTKEGGTVCSKPLLFSLSPKTVANMVTMLISHAFASLSVAALLGAV